MAYLNVPIIALYIGFLPFSVNGQYVAPVVSYSHNFYWDSVIRWWSCVVIGLASQWWARTRKPAWFKKVLITMVHLWTLLSLLPRHFQV